MAAVQAHPLTATLVTFWERALNQPEVLSETQRQAMQAALASQRMSARDLLWRAIGEHPQQFGLYVTLAELLILDDEPEHAATLCQRLQAVAALQPVPELSRALSRLQLHLVKTLDPQTLCAVATHLITEGDAIEQDTYLPTLLALLADQDRDRARDLAEQWFTHTNRPPAWWSSVYHHLLATHRVPEHAPEPVPTPQTSQEWALALLWHTLRAPEEGIETLQHLLERVRQQELDVDAVLRTLQPFLALFPPALPASLVTASLWLASGNISAAAQAGETLRAATDWRIQLLGHVMTGYAQLALGHQQAALEPIHTAFALLQRHPEGVGTLAHLVTPPVTLPVIAELLCRLLAQTGKLNELAEIVANLVASATISSAQAQAYARLLIQRGAPQHARRILRQVAEVQQQQRDIRGYVQTLRELVVLAPDDAGVRDTFVHAAATLGIEPALNLLEELALHLGTRGYRGAASALLQRATELALMSPPSWPRIPRLYEQLITFAPDDLTLRHAAVTAFIQIGQRDHAKAQLREIARLAIARNEPENALAALHQVVALDPQDPEGYHRLGELLVSLGEIEQAERVYRRLLALTPNDAIAKARHAALSQHQRSADA